MKKLRALSCFILALCLVFYAVPRLPIKGLSDMASGFSLIWVAFAMLVIGGNLLYVIGTDQTGLDKKRMKGTALFRTMPGRQHSGILKRDVFKG